MDIKIEKRTSNISATYYFNYGGTMKHLTDIIGMADDLAFFGRKDNAYDIVMRLISTLTLCIGTEDKQIPNKQLLQATPPQHIYTKSHQYLVNN